MASLQQRITTLAQAIGTDVKTLEAVIQVLQSKPQITVSAIAPDNPQLNDLWVDISGV